MLFAYFCVLQRKINHCQLTIVNPMMKTVYFIRHAKSSWSDPSLSDRHRPLDKRGFRDAPFMAQLLSSQVKSIDQIVSSPATRAHTTAQFFAEAFHLDKGSIHLDPNIYLAYPEALLQIIQNFEPSWNTVLFFGHNPAFTDIANRFAQDYIENVPTCGIVEVQAKINDWKFFGQPKLTKVVNFQFPKQFFT